MSMFERVAAAIEDEFFKVREFGTDRGIITPERIAAKAIDVTQDTQRIKELVDRFLQWPLPKGHASDGCASDPDYQHPRYGTHLLTATEAQKMFEYLFNCDQEK